MYMHIYIYIYIYIYIHIYICDVSGLWWHPCLGKWASITRAVVYCVRTVGTFSAGL